MYKNINAILFNKNYFDCAKCFDSTKFVYFYVRTKYLTVIKFEIWKTDTLLEDPVYIIFKYAYFIQLMPIEARKEQELNDGCNRET